ncbi:class I SAM-dependent DNA methyltransferase [Tropicibacter sp. S64]|uniref:class I SAM-dependent DNA methyltransferase n=1 Tax=Tropicibacter sp. S64 TaxID=3415122 RepID=UPI003C7D30FE
MTTDTAPFWDRIADTYAARAVDNPAAWETTLERCRHWLRPEATALELGCGTGSTALKLADAVADYTGTDVSGAMIRIAQGKDAPGHLRFVRAEAEAALAPGVDVVLAFNLLHLIADLPPLLGQVYDALPSGGLFLSKTPCLGHKPWLRPVIWAMRCFGKAPPGVRYVTVGQLEAMIRAAGFEVLETGGYPASLPNQFIVARKP